MSVHPRWRGEHPIAAAIWARASGSSPLARGTPGRSVPRHDCCRFIPAGAGNTRSRTATGSCEAVHPRWRGEHRQISVRASSLSGSSPLARGTRTPYTEAEEDARFIPAGAGNTSSAAELSTRVTVHPRWRGEHPIAAAIWARASGSSPLARGTLEAGVGHGSDSRFIPAGAGNTGRHAGWPSRSPVHPRWRGEHAVARWMLAMMDGSSPLARGTLVEGDAAGGVDRFIPAGAGNTQTLRPPSWPYPVHPRWRGEHISSCPCSRSSPGSSPLARGTLPNGD